jgi:hypothetical protein
MASQDVDATGYLLAGNEGPSLLENNLYFAHSLVPSRKQSQPMRFAAAAALGADPNLDEGDLHMAGHMLPGDTEPIQQQSSASAPEKSTVQTELSVTLERLVALDNEADIFTVPTRQRNDTLNFFQQVVQTIVIILAVLHNKYIDQHSNIILVIAVLWGISFLNTQITYGLARWTNRMVSIRRLVQRAETIHKPVAVANSNGEETLSLQEQLELREQQRVRAELEEARRRGVLMQAQVWLGSSAEIVGFLNRGLVLIATYVAFLLVRIIMDRLDANFSDGHWLTYRIMTFILLVAPVYVEFHISNYRQTTPQDDLSAAAGR